MNIGIYMITCTSNNRCYIGSSIELDRRIYHHKSCLRCNTHKNKHLQNAYNKYGINAFEYEIVAYCNEDILLELEQFVINCYDFNKLFNINPHASGGVKFSEETINRRNKSIANTWTNKSKRYKLWKAGKLTPTKDELIIFNKWSNHKPWNKGKKYKSTDHLKVPKLKRGNRSRVKETMRNKAPEVYIFDVNKNFIMKFRSARDIQDYSLTNHNLPIISRFTKPRMSVPVNYLSSGNINKSIKTGKPYKGLYFSTSPVI